MFSQSFGQKFGHLSIAQKRKEKKGNLIFVPSLQFWTPFNKTFFAVTQNKLTCFFNLLWPLSTK
jgi:hypothetical protein